MHNGRILLIDDDSELSELVHQYLQLDGYSMDWAADGLQGLKLAKQQSYALILLDVMLPGIDGFAVLKQLRQQQYYCPVLMLTARGDDIDRILGLELGADDYLAKPFNPRELTARVKAILRRVELAKQPEATAETTMLEWQALQLNRSNRQVHFQQQPVSLTATEFQILELLIKHGGEIVSKETLSKVVLGRALQPFDRSLDMHISNIRKKLQHASPNADVAQLLQTLRGSGYLLCAD